MKFARLWTIVFTVFVQNVEAVELPDQLIAAGKEQIDVANAALAIKAAAVAQAITSGSKTGKLKPSTEAYFRDCVAKFQPSPAGRVEFEALYYPPRFDTSEEMEPIFLAFDDLRQAAKRLQEAEIRFAQDCHTAAANAIQTASQSAEKPEDLDSADTLIAACKDLPDPQSPRFSSFSGIATPVETLSRISIGMRGALEGRNKNDPLKLTASLQSVQTYPGSNFNDGRLAFRIEAVWEAFRKRMSAPFLRAAIESQRDLENRLMERKPSEEINAALTDFDARASLAEKIGQETRPGYNQDGHSNVLGTYRAVQDTLANLERDASGRRATFALNNNPAMDGTYAISAKFRTFMSTLSIEAEEKQRIALAKAEEVRRAEAQREAAMQAREAQDQLATTAATIREKLASAKAPQDLLAVADALPQWYSKASQNGQFNDGQQWPMLQFDLRTIARQWAAGDTELGGRAGGRRTDGQGLHGFAADLDGVVDRVLREIVATRYGADEIRKPPLSELSAAMAIRQVARQAGEQGDWMRAHQLLSTLSSVETEPVFRARISAIHSYLAGLNFEQAEDYRNAVLQFERVLEQTVDQTPIRETASHLKAIRTAHPDAFISATKDFSREGSDEQLRPTRPSVPIFDSAEDR